MGNGAALKQNEEELKQKRLNKRTNCKDNSR